MAEQTIRVNVPDGYEVVSIAVPRAGVDYVLCGDDVILAPATVYSRVIVRKVMTKRSTRCECGHAKSQHNCENNVCDYQGYSCDCTGYKRGALSYKVGSTVKCDPPASDGASDLVAICRRADQLRSAIMQTWTPPLKAGGESMSVVAQTATMQTIAYIMGPEFMGKLDRNQQQAIDSGMLLFRAAFEDAKA